MNLTVTGRREKAGSRKKQPYFIYAIPTVIALILLLFSASNVSGATSGKISELVDNERKQIYIYNIRQELPTDPGALNKHVDVEVTIKNLTDDAAVMNIFFTTLIDESGNEYRINPLRSTILPIRIPSDDIITGRISFVIPTAAVPSVFVWNEQGQEAIRVDLTASKNPADTPPTSSWILESNKGKTASDGRSSLTILETAWTESPRFYVVEILLENNSEETISYSRAFAYVKDEQGFIYPIDLENTNLLRNPLSRGELQPQESVTGMLIFSLPQYVDDVMFIYDEDIGRGSYLVIPEFPYQLIVLLTSFSIVIITTVIKRHTSV